MSMTGGTKHDQGKPQLHLIWWPFVWGMARVLMFGAKKYAAYNWQKGISWSRLWDAEGRHMQSFWDGEDVDPETGEPHFYHAAVNLMFLAWHHSHRKDLDDRPPTSKESPSDRARVSTVRQVSDSQPAADRAADAGVPQPAAHGDRPSI